MCIYTSSLNMTYREVSQASHALIRTCISKSRIAPSVQAARRQLPSWLTATHVIGAPKLSDSSSPMRTSNCRTVPSTLPATIWDLGHATKGSGYSIVV